MIGLAWKSDKVAFVVIGRVFDGKKEGCRAFLLLWNLNATLTPSTDDDALESWQTTIAM